MWHLPGFPLCSAFVPAFTCKSHDSCLHVATTSQTSSIRKSSMPMAVHLEAVRYPLGIALGCFVSFVFYLIHSFCKDTRYFSGVICIQERNHEPKAHVPRRLDFMIPQYRDLTYPFLSGCSNKLLHDSASLILFCHTIVLHSMMYPGVFNHPFIKWWFFFSFCFQFCPMRNRAAVNV